MESNLRPLTLGEILDRTAQLYRTHFWLFAGISAVYSTEPPATPHDLHYDGGDGFRCVCPGGTNDFHSCEERRLIYGTASFVTGAFGLAAASVVVRAIAAG